MKPKKRYVVTEGTVKDGFVFHEFWSEDLSVMITLTDIVPDGKYRLVLERVK